MRRLRIRKVFGASSQSSSSRLLFPFPTEVPRLNDSLYEFYKPREGASPSVEIVFFHGLSYFGDAKTAFVDTWTSFDGSTAFCWPMKFLPEDFPEARILSVSYDSSITKGERSGHIDLHCLAENLIIDLTGSSGKVAHKEDLPLILVGQDFGGLIIKAVCCRANEQHENARCKSLLQNIKGIFYYCPPHLGLRTVPPQFTSELARTLNIFDNVIARLNFDFSQLRQRRRWRAKAIVAAYPGDQPFSRSGVEIPEASSRYDVDSESYYTANEGIDSVCKPKEKYQKDYSFLSELVQEFVRHGSPHSVAVTTQHSVAVTWESSLGFKKDNRYVPMKSSLQDVQNAFKKSNTVVLSGASGTGKSSLAKYYALHVTHKQAREAADLTAQASTTPSVAAVFLDCGPTAKNVDKQEELLRKFNVKLDQDSQHQLDSYRSSPISPNTGCEAVKDPEHVVRRLHEVLEKHLKKHHALVILDDVWETELIEKVFVQDEECQLQYLVTTQISSLWNDGENVKIQDIDEQDALKILANYADLPGGEIARVRECEDIAKDIVRKVQSHPLENEKIQDIDEQGVLKVLANNADLLEGEIARVLECEDIAKDIVRNVQSHPLENVKIQDIDEQGVLKILAYYVDLIGEEIARVRECEDIAKDIVRKVQSHPLALATLGTFFRTDKSKWTPQTMVEGWKGLRFGLMGYLNSTHNYPSAFGKPYKKGVYASMKMVDELGKDEERLLHVITLFEGPSISEAVVQVFLMYIRPEEGLELFGSRRQTLEARNLVQVETKYLLPPVQESFEVYARGATRTEGRMFTNLRVHSLQQQFILETPKPGMKKPAVDEITSFLNKWNFRRWGSIPNLEFTSSFGEKWKFLRRGDISNLHMATLLCALFGVKSVKEKAMAKIRDSRVKSMCVNICTAAPSALTALVSLMAAIFKKERSIQNSIAAKSITKVFWTLLMDGRLDDRNISYLLGTREWKKWTCVFLEELGSVVSAAGLDSQSRALTHESSGSNVRGREGLTVEMDIAFCLPRSLDMLVTFLSPDEEAWMQTRALAKLTLAGTDVDGKLRYNLKRTTNMLRSFITFLSNPNEVADRRLFAARFTREIFVQVEGGIEDSDALPLFIPHVGELAELLTKDVPTRIQQEVLCGLRVAIQAVCSKNSIDPVELRAVLKITDLLHKMVPLLAIEQTRSNAIALIDTLLNCFHSSEEALPYVIRTAALFPGCFETMVELLTGMLAQDEHLVGAGGKDRVALKTLCLIAISGKCQILERLTETRGLLERVTTRLTKGNKAVCLAAATFVRCLSREMCPSISFSIAEQEGCLENLVGLLDEDTAENIQVEALKALISLSKSNDVRVCHRILETEGLLEKIIVCVTNNREIHMSKIFSISFCRKAYYRRRYFRNPFHLRRPSFNPFYFDVCPFEDSRGLKASLFANLVENPFMRARLKNKLAVLKGKSLGAHILSAVEFAHVVILDGVESSDSVLDQQELRMVHVLGGSGAVHDRGLPGPAVDQDGVNSSESLFWRSRREAFGELDFSMKFFNFLCASFADLSLLFGEDAAHNVTESPLSLEMSPLFFVGFQVGVLCFLAFVILFHAPWDFVLVFWNTLTLGSPFYFYLVCMQDVVPNPMWFTASNLCIFLSTICCFKTVACIAFQLVNFWFSFLVLIVMLVYLGVAYAPFLGKVEKELLQHFFNVVVLCSWLKDCWDHLSLYVFTSAYLYVFFLVYSWWPRWTRWVREFLFNWALHRQSFLVSFIGACDFFLDVFGFFWGGHISCLSSGA